MSDHSNIFAQCLQAIEAGDTTIDECVARYPQVKDLRTMLHVALELHDLPSQGMSELQKLTLERTLLQVMDAHLRVRQQQQANSWRWLRPIAMVAAVLVFVILSNVVLLNVSAKALPGDALYGYKRTAETIALALASPTARADVLTTQAQQRLDELNTLIALAKPVEPEFVQTVTRQVNEALSEQQSAAERTALHAQAIASLANAVAHGVSSAQDQIALLLPPDFTPPVAALTPAAPFTSTPSLTALPPTFAPTVKPLDTNVPSLTPLLPTPQHTAIILPTTTPNRVSPTATLTPIVVNGPTQTSLPLLPPTTIPVTSSTNTPFVPSPIPVTMPATNTVAPTWTPTSTAVPTVIPTATATVTLTPTATYTLGPCLPPTATFTPTAKGAQPTRTPDGFVPSLVPSPYPCLTWTPAPTVTHTATATETPTTTPTALPPEVTAEATESQGS